MEPLALFGVCWRHGRLGQVARFTRARDERAACLHDLRARTGAREVLYLATCNRVEVALLPVHATAIRALRGEVFATLAGRAPEPGEAERVLRVWAGEGAVEHLFLVTAGLDSARVCEQEITGQVREAWELARAAGTCGAELDFLLGEALKVAARVHRQAVPDADPRSLAEIALRHLRLRLAATPGPVALIGASAMTRNCGRALRAGGVAGLTVASRTLASAQHLAGELAADAVTLAAFVEDPPAVEAVLLATGAPHAVLDRAALERLAARAPSGRPPLLVDLALPPDVAPADAIAAGLPRLGIDEIAAEADAGRRRALIDAGAARLLVDDALELLRRRAAERIVAPCLAALQRRYRATAREGVERLCRRALAGLGLGEREALLRWADTLARRFAHLPTEGLKEVAVAFGTAGVDAFFAPADAALRQELQAGARPALEPEEAS